MDAATITPRTNTDKAREQADPRIARGLELFRGHGEGITDSGGGFYLVPSASRAVTYMVDTNDGSCTCPDHRRRQRIACKHLYAATVYRAKAVCRRRRELAGDPREIAA